MAVTPDTGSTNPSLSSYVGKWNSAQASAQKSIKRPADPDRLRQQINDSAGGGLAFNPPEKIPSVRQAIDGRTFNIKTNMPTGGTDLSRYSWNLPPHKWSQPIEPNQQDSLIGDSKRWDGISNPVNRRGRIYWYARNDATWTNATSVNYGNNANDPRYGFHFLWNPESFQTSVAVNMDITPTSNDKFAKVIGAFPSGESLSVNLVLDRTNDLFCLRSHRTGQSSFVTDWSQFYEYYQGFSFENPGDKGYGESMNRKLQELQQYGTLADIEYIYKAINGPGWKNPVLDRETSDIGFLLPTLLKIEIGPIGYLGYVNALNVTHNAFTKGMIPMRSTVSIQFNLMATAGLASQGKLVSQ